MTLSNNPSAKKFIEFLDDHDIDYECWYDIDNDTFTDKVIAGFDVKNTFMFTFRSNTDKIEMKEVN